MKDSTQYYNVRIEIDKGGNVLMPWAHMLGSAKKSKLCPKGMREWKTLKAQALGRLAKKLAGSGWFEK